MSYCFHPHCPNPHNPKHLKACCSCGSKLLLKSRYRILQPVSRGRFVSVFQAIDCSTSGQQTILVKQILLPEAVLRDPATRHPVIEIFNNIAQTLQNLKDVDTLQTPIDYSTMGNGLYLIEEPYEGVSLSSLIEEQQGLTEPQLLKLLNDLLPSLHILHSHSLVHHDIQPDNIVYLQNTNTFRLVNLGVPQSVIGRMQNRLPHIGEYLVGDPSYSPPEQISGKPVSQSDLYSLGVCCLHAATAVEPIYLLDHSGQTWNYKHYLVNNPLSSGFCQVLEKMIAGSVHDRYSTAQEVLESLNDLHSHPQSSDCNSTNLLRATMNLFGGTFVKLTKR